jgi:hypothetical protein
MTEPEGSVTVPTIVARSWATATAGKSKKRSPKLRSSKKRKYLCFSMEFLLETEENREERKGWAWIRRHMTMLSTTQHPSARAEKTRRLIVLLGAS